MNKKIDPRQVLSYLNELGFTNINAQQLKEFIIDLKKLMKHDTRYPEQAETFFSFAEEQPYIPEGNGCYDFSEPGKNVDSTNESTRFAKSSIKSQKNQAVNATSSHTQKTTNAPPNEVLRKDKLISVHIHKRPTETIRHEHCIHIEPNTGQTSDFPNIERLQLSKELTTESTIKSTRPDSRFSSQTRGTCPTTCGTTKSRVAFIKQNKAKPAFSKCDPVALYHYYQSEWKRTKIPGQESRDDLRWAIREKMLNGPKVEVKPNLRKRCSSYSIGSSWR